jgi:hypothetical protein
MKMNGKNKTLELYNYNGLNENAKFKVPSKLPTVMYFRSGMHLDEQPVELDRFKLLKSIGDNHQVERNKLDKIL